MFATKRQRRGMAWLLVMLVALDCCNCVRAASISTADASVQARECTADRLPRFERNEDERDTYLYVRGRSSLAMRSAARDDEDGDLNLTQCWLSCLQRLNSWSYSSSRAQWQPLLLASAMFLGLIFGPSQSGWAQSLVSPRLPGTSHPIDLLKPPEAPINFADIAWVEPQQVQVGDDSSSGIIGKALGLLRGGNVTTTPVDEYPRIPGLDCDDPNSFFYTWRPNIVGQEVTEAWDFYNLVATDRRDFTDATFSAGAGVVIFETGHTYDKMRTADTRVGFQQVPEMTIRSGITDEFELRFKWLGIAMIDQTDVPSGDRLKDFGSQDINQIGFKYEVGQQDGWWPMITVLGTVGAPSGAPNFSGRAAPIGFNNVLGWGLRRWLYLKISQGVDFYGKPSFVHDPAAGTVPFRVEVDNVSEWHQSVSVLSQFSKHVGLFHEWYVLYRGDAIDNRPDHFIDTGIFLYCTPNVQLDFRAGTRLSDRVSEQFYGSGFSLRY